MLIVCRGVLNDRGAVMAEWIRPHADFHTRGSRFKSQPAVVPLGKALCPH